MMTSRDFNNLKQNCVSLLYFQIQHAECDSGNVKLKIEKK